MTPDGSDVRSEAGWRMADPDPSPRELLAYAEETIRLLREKGERTAAKVERLEGEARKLWARDHARGHRATTACPVCVKFGHAPDITALPPDEDG